MEKENKPHEFQQTLFFDLSKKLQDNARKLRVKQTPAEKLLWEHLRNRKLNGFKFRRQHPLQKGFVLDFYCVETKIGIELDGGYHTGIHQTEYDEGRTYEIKEYGIRVLRFWNEDVFKNIESVLEEIVKACFSRIKQI